MIGLQAQEGNFIPRSGTMEIKLSKTHLEVGTKEPERSSDVDFLNETGTRARLGHKHPLFPLPLEIALRGHPKPANEGHLKTGQR